MLITNTLKVYFHIFNINKVACINAFTASEYLGNLF